MSDDGRASRRIRLGGPAPWGVERPWESDVPGLGGTCQAGWPTLGEFVPEMMARRCVVKMMIWSTLSR